MSGFALKNLKDEAVSKNNMTFERGAEVNVLRSLVFLFSIFRIKKKKLYEF